MWNRRKRSKFILVISCMSSYIPNSVVLSSYYQSLMKIDYKYLWGFIYCSQNITFGVNILSKQLGAWIFHHYYNLYHYVLSFYFKLADLIIKRPSLPLWYVGTPQKTESLFSQINAFLMEYLFKCDKDFIVESESIMNEVSRASFLNKYRTLKRNSSQFIEINES